MPNRAQVKAAVLAPPPEPAPESFGAQLAQDMPRRSQIGPLLFVLALLFAAL